MKRKKLHEYYVSKNSHIAISLQGLAPYRQEYCIGGNFQNANEFLAYNATREKPRPPSIYKTNKPGLYRELHYSDLRYNLFLQQFEGASFIQRASESSDRLRCHYCINRIKIADSYWHYFTEDDGSQCEGYICMNCYNTYRTEVEKEYNQIFSKIEE